MRYIFTLFVFLFFVKVNAQVVTLLNKTNIACTNDLTGTATFSINGSAFPYDASAFGCNNVFVLGINTNTFTVAGIGNCLPYMSTSPNGEYTLTVSDNTSNIVGILTFSMTSTNPYFLLQQSFYKNINCPNANNGISQWQTVFGSGPFSYLWSTSTTTNYATGPSINNASPGTYSITATDGAGCKQTWSTNFTNPYIYKQITHATLPTCCNGSLTYNVVGIVPPPVFSYSISPAITSNTTVCSGIYTITATSGTCTASDTVSIGCVTGIDNIGNLSPTLKIFPNPVSSVLNIGAIPEGSEDSKIKITNSLGQTILEIPFTDALDVSLLPKGYYFLTILKTDGQRVISRFTKE